LGKALSEVRILHFVFVATWFLFLLLPWYLGSSSLGLPDYLPIVLGLVCVSDIAIASVLRTRYISTSAEILRAEPENQAALAKWRMGNVISFTFAQTVTLFGFLLRFLGAQWKVAGVFFAAGLLLLLLWTPRAITTTDGRS
jgi:hypothetical protein